MSSELNDKVNIAQIANDVAILRKSVGRIENKLDPDSEHYMLKSISARIDPIEKVFEGTSFITKFIAGLSSLVIAVGAIGAAILYTVNWIRHGS
jgi:hypothetical protein